jgi:1-deoxy-D-xylulose-5-phosphate reductoisomerase
MKNVAILGSTGSIGQSALDVIARHGDRFRVVGLSAYQNVELIAKQAEEFKPEVVAVAEPAAADELRRMLKNPVLSGQEGICAVASHKDADFVLTSIVGSAGLLPTLAAVKAGKTIGLANKETLVAAGEIVMAEAEKCIGRTVRRKEP